MSGSYIQNYVASSPYASVIADAEGSNGIPSGLLGAGLYQESTLGLYGSQGNGGGIGQFIPATAQQYNVDVTNDYSGISGAAQYLHDLYYGTGTNPGTGSWVAAYQQYGTLPSNLSNLTPGQQNVYDLASQADASGSGTQSGSASPAASPGTAQNKSGGSNLNPANWLPNFENWISTSLFHVGIFVLAIVFIIFGLADLAFGVKPAQVVTKIKAI